MKKRISAFILLLTTLLCFCSCSLTSNDTTFSIHFIDVGQGDSALVECDGHYMLIDGGDTTAGNKVYDVLLDYDVKKLDYLVLSHLHSDHIGGLTKGLKALRGKETIGRTISNASSSPTEVFLKFKHELDINGSKITVPAPGDKYKLGSATVEVVDVSAEQDNDSLVLLITYGNTKFLFTGDIVDTAQTRISEKYQNDSDKPYKIDLIKMPHHGSYTGTLYRFMRTFMPDYAIISVGTGNTYGHPDSKTMDLLNSKTWKPKVYRTDLNGDIVVKSNGKELSVKSSKNG